MASRRNLELTPFTPRELELIRLYVERGLCTKEAAWELHISYATADTHRSNIMRKLRRLLNVCEYYRLSSIDLALYALTNELVNPAEIYQKYSRAAIPCS
jgi:DNA-binding NarL/FixJ family response regulator